MEIINSIDDLSLSNTAVCIGNFDGFHLGHKKIILTLKEYAKNLNLKTVIFTFNPHPYKFFKKDISLISSPYQRLEIFKAQNTDYLVTANFNEELSSLPAEDFFKKIVIEKLDAKVLVVGKDYRFGANRHGDINLLEKLGNKYGIKCVFVDKVKDSKGEEISSTKIRNLIKTCNLNEVKECLGRYYSITGKVVIGSGKGKTFGYPTINIDSENELLLNTGSYATNTLIDNEIYKSMTYVGICPTVTDKNLVKIETNIFNFNKDIYGKNVEIFFKDYIRQEEKFNSVCKLISAMNKDKLKAENCE